jgi:superfamily II DNA/RNA helicase
MGTGGGFLCRNASLTFSELNLNPGLLRALDAAGHVEPTPVQAAAIPPGLTGQDVLATADTGTGKTGAFILPALDRLLRADEDRVGPRPFGPRVLVLAPTRELARQVAQAARVYAKYSRLFIADIVGGMPFGPQMRDLSRTVDVLIATPGRLMDHIGRRSVSLGEVEVLVLDEADRMLDLGFAEDIAAIASLCPNSRQTMLFTATLDRRMEGIAKKLIRHDAARVAVDHRPENAPKIEQRLFVADDLDHKRRLLNHFAEQDEVEKAIVFAATKRDAELLAANLAADGHSAAALHGDMMQRDRSRTLTQLRDGRVRLLVATDVAARGLDVRDISHVINFDLPRNPEDYIHRIGRTGRAGAEGIAISFATRNDRGALMAIERLTGAPVEVHVVPGLEAVTRLDPPANRNGKRPPHRGRPQGGYGKGPGQGQNKSKSQPGAGSGRPAQAQAKPRRAASNGGWSPLAKRSGRD